MNKAKLIEVLAEKTNKQAKKDEEYINKKVAERMLDILTDTITDELKHNREVTITGFGTFEAMVRYARGGVNPRNPKERITIPAVKVAKFRTGKNLKDALKMK
ncbi:MAG TPA: HU family DNA-binding protein [bacterium]|nr:HU family DNA-binding protein [bacterium]HPT29401.1 HU family DNA-binding protein [bacterium]